MAKRAQVDGRTKPSQIKLQGAVVTWNPGLCSLLCVTKKSWLRVCSLSAGSPRRGRLEVSSVHTNRFRSQDGTSHTRVGTLASGPLQSKPSPRRGKRVAPKLTNARDEVGRMEAWGYHAALPAGETYDKVLEHTVIYGRTVVPGTLGGSNEGR